jgi:molecular chaperone HtpG
MCAPTESSTKYTFQAEINQLLSLIINAFYSNKDIFIRELLSNASDAIDKMRYISLTDSSKSRSFEMKLKADKESKKLTIEDNGIGMSKDDLVQCLGTIANSGTKQFMQNLKEGTADVSLIGQFGVGFYSSYLVAENVRVFSKKEDEPCYVWESDAGGSFTITEVSAENPVLEKGGTLIELTMKDDCLEYLEQNKLQSIIKDHCQYLTHPIMLHTVRTEKKEEIIEDDEDDEDIEEIDGDALSKAKTEEETPSTEDTPSTDETPSTEDTPKEVTEEVKDEKKDNEDEKPKPPKTRTVEHQIEEWKQVNQDKPIWLRKASDVTQEEYASFYKSLTNSSEDHLAVKHFSAEGQIEFKALLYLSKTQRSDMFQKSKDANNNIKLYVKRVFIMDNCDKLVPEWLSCISGLVDSEDLPLNVSREMLQQNSIMKIIKKNIVKKSIELFTELSEDDTEEGQEKYKTFYQNFSKNIKLGIHEDSGNRTKLIRLLRFYSHTSPDKLISFDNYVENMKDDDHMKQKNIYYITGQNVHSLKNTPFVKNLVHQGFDVLFMTEAIDEYIIQHLDKYEDHKLVNITKENADIEGNKIDEDTKKTYEGFCKKIKEVIGDQVTKVTVSNLPEDEPCCVTAASFGWSANMERIMKAQTLQANSVQQQANYMTKRNLELNPQHKMIKKLYNDYAASSMNEAMFKSVVMLLFQTAMISSGYIQEDPSSYSKKVYDMISMGMSVADDDDDAAAETPSAETPSAETPDAGTPDAGTPAVGTPDEDMEALD